MRAGQRIEQGQNCIYCDTTEVLTIHSFCIVSDHISLDTWSSITRLTEFTQNMFFFSVNREVSSFDVEAGC